MRKKASTATIIIPKIKEGIGGWLESNMIKNSTFVTLFKKVSKELKTQERTMNETLWAFGKIIEIGEWNPKENECGDGKFHACSRPYFCDEFRNKKDDKYIAIKINEKDLYAWPSPQYPHKIAFRKGMVIYECDRFGKRIE